MTNLLDLLPEYVLYWLVQKGQERTLREKEVLITEGERNDSLFIVLDGLFGAYQSSVERVLEHYAPGSVLGETSIFASGAAPASIIAQEDSLVLEISRLVLDAKLAHDSSYASDFYQALMVSVAERLNHVTQKLFAAEAEMQIDASRDPIVRKAQGEIDGFKQLMLHLDREGIKNGKVAEESYQKFATHAHRVMMTCHEVLGANSPLSEGVKNQIGARLQHEMLPYILTTETADRFYSKPRGYAGDYLAIHKIYDNVPGGTGRLGPLVDRMFLETPPSLAVRNRRTLLANEIVSTVNAKKEGPVSVMCMASGPATEVFDAFNMLDDKSRLKATLMDIDLQSLAFVDEIRTKQKLTSNIHLVNENLIALYLGRSKTKVPPQDLIYSIGLIDYLNDKLVGKLLQYVYENLAPQGRVILGTFHPRNPAKEFMDYVLEWNLIHRTEEDMNRLFTASPFRRACTKIQFESEGVNLFAECVKA
ncbi:MAG TPA: cyclic nucleotide-binding domain-containing protein [Bacteroidota bacterium]|nr:cyclic nucleotide-binding domain-containing protein [Bacteroidota bacterium]